MMPGSFGRERIPQDDKSSTVLNNGHIHPLFHDLELSIAEKFNVLLCFQL